MCTEGILTRGWELFLTGCFGASTLTRGATLEARWIYELETIVVE